MPSQIPSACAVLSTVAIVAIVVVCVDWLLTAISTKRNVHQPHKSDFKGTDEEPYEEDIRHEYAFQEEHAFQEENAFQEEHMPNEYMERDFRDWSGYDWDSGSYDQD
jgi:hypothetical protein